MALPLLVLRLRFRVARQLCAMPQGYNPDNILFNPVEKAIRGNNHLSVMNIGELRESASGLREVLESRECFFRLVPKRNRR
jgi:hypothetical protein